MRRCASRWWGRPSPTTLGGTRGSGAAAALCAAGFLPSTPQLPARRQSLRSCAPRRPSTYWWSAPGRTATTTRAAARRPHGRSSTRAAPGETCRVQVDMVAGLVLRRSSSSWRYRTAMAHGGYYHVVHFDVHGALLRYADFLATAQPAGCRRRRPGCANLPGSTTAAATCRPTRGSEPLLSWRAARRGQAEPGRGRRNRRGCCSQHQVPIAILNACQSGKQVGDRETASSSCRLARAGSRPCWRWAIS